MHIKRPTHKSFKEKALAIPGVKEEYEKLTLEGWPESLMVSKKLKRKIIK